MHVEISSVTDEARLDGDRAARLETVLADVRAAVADWRAMHEDAASACGARSPSTPPPVGAEERGEALDFLAWLARRQFHLPRLSANTASAARQRRGARHRPDSGLGILRDESVIGVRRAAQFRDAARPRCAPS